MVYDTPCVTPHVRTPGPGGSLIPRSRAALLINAALLTSAVTELERLRLPAETLRALAVAERRR